MERSPLVYHHSANAKRMNLKAAHPRLSTQYCLINFDCWHEKACRLPRIWKQPAAAELLPVEEKCLKMEPNPNHRDVFEEKGPTVPNERSQSMKREVEMIPQLCWRSDHLRQTDRQTGMDEGMGGRIDR